MQAFTLTATACAVLALSATGALAREPGAASPAASWYLLPSVQVLDPDSRFEADRRGEGMALRLGTALSPNWGLQFGPSYARSRQGDARYRQNTLGADAVYFFSTERLRPLLMVGAGAQYDRVSSPGLNAHQTSPYISAGLGFQYDFSAQWGVQADLRRSRAYLRNDDFGFKHANSNILSLGLSYALDKPRQPMRAASLPPPTYTPASSAPIALAVAPAAPEPMARFERYTLSSTELFAFDSADLTGSPAKLDEIAAALKQHAEPGNVLITGYTDRLGSEDYNMRLSQRRADAVRDYLAKQGVPSSRLTALARGEATPLVDCSDSSRQALIDCLEPNRRSEVAQIVIERRLP